ncbi:MAG: SRPBCC family protein, partial [Proteobacteria bacterium]|nr:SRPBCC family protein [Pseudomonadota bacterium]
RVKEDGEGKTTVEWSSEFEAKGAAENEAMDVIAGIYQVGFDNLKKIFGG